MAPCRIGIMVARVYTPADIHAVDAMFKEHDKDGSPLDLAPSSGVVVEEDGEIMGVSFLYMTNSPIAMLDLSCVRKSLDKDKRNQVLDLLIVALQNMAKHYGYKYIVCDPIYKKSERRLIDHGFIKGNKEVYWYEVKNG